MILLGLCLASCQHAAIAHLPQELASVDERRVFKVAAKRLVQLLPDVAYVRYAACTLGLL